jgi:hypothetical protein
VARSEQPVGDPAFRDDPGAITHEPIRESERGAGRAPYRSSVGQRVDPRSAQTYVWPFAAIVLVGLTIVAGLAAGWAYAIPFAVFAGVAIFLFVSHGALAGLRQTRHGGVKGARRAVVEDSDESIPSVDFGERAEEPGIEPQADSTEDPHADLRRGTGRR